MSIFSVGYSFSRDPRRAVEEAYNQALKGLDGRPCLALVFSSYRSYPSPEAIAVALEAVAPGLPFAGVSTAGEYVLDKSLTGSLVLGLFSSRYFRAGVGFSRGLGFKAGVEAARMAVEGLQAAPSLGILFSAPGGEEEALKGVRSVVGPQLIVAGGSSGDDYLLKPPYGYQLSSAGVGSSSTVFVALESRVPIAVVGGHACRPTGRRGLVSKASGSRLETIVEINGRPAVEVYSEWLGVSVDRLVREMLSIGLLNPLGVRDPVTGYLYVKHPAVASREGVTCFARVGEGVVVELLEHDRRESIVLASKLVEEAKRRLGGCLGGLILVHCAGSAAFIGGEGREELVSLAYRAAGCPLLGFAAYGEQWGYYDYGVWTAHQNLTTVVIGFGCPAR